jgi:hypothetical protein
MLFITFYITYQFVLQWLYLGNTIKVKLGFMQTNPAASEINKSFCTLHTKNIQLITVLQQLNENLNKGAMRNWKDLVNHQYRTASEHVQHFGLCYLVTPTGTSKL